MPEPDQANVLTFETPLDLCEWLQANHAIESELWVRIFKKHSGIQSVDWDDVVIEVLCWGWIDGIKKSLDDQSYLQRITPRKSQSSWSKRNTEHVELLINEGRMKEPGLMHVHAAKADGRWDEAYVVSEFVVPDDFLSELEKHLSAKEFFETLNKSNRYVIAYGLTSAKKEETRQRRFSKYLSILMQGEKPK